MTCCGISARTHLVITSLPMAIASWYAWTSQFYMISIAVGLLTISSTLYHLDDEGITYSNFDKSLCIFDAIIVQFYAFLCPLTWEMILTWLFWFSGIVCWKLGHKCHCRNRKYCGHKYRRLPLLFHCLWHLIATGSIIIVIYHSQNSWRNQYLHDVPDISNQGRVLLGLS